MRILFLMLMATNCYAQMDNSTVSRVSNAMTINITTPNTITNIADKAGNLLTITVVPDLLGPKRLDAIAACKTAVTDANAALDVLLNANTAQTTANAWWRPQAVTAKTSATNAQAKLLLLEGN